MTRSMQEIIQEAYNEIPQIKPEEALDMQKKWSSNYRYQRN